MKVICAWCGKELEDTLEQDVSSNFEITHGICQSCADYFFSDQTYTMDKFLNQLDKPVLMIDPEGAVLFANNEALQALGKDLESVKGFLGGDVMECVYARLPEGCGKTSHCLACTVRNNVVKTFEMGKSLKRVPAFLNRLDRQSVHRVEFLISTEKVNNTVLLRIDEMEAG